MCKVDLVSCPGLSVDASISKDVTLNEGNDVLKFWHMNGSYGNNSFTHRDKP
jgi:hypothetical protein